MKPKEVLIHITSGRGPAECGWVVTKVLSKLIADIKKQGMAYEVIYRENGDEAGTLLSASIKVCGVGVEQFTKSWQGTIQWVGKSPYRKYHKRKNWFVGVSCSPTSKPKQICEKDICYQVYRAGGPGGQHVNKVSTAVRAVHVPTKLAVAASDTRSQVQNKKLATQRLLELLKQKDSEQSLQEQQNLWGDHNSLNRGNPIRTFKGREFTEVSPIEKQLE